MKRKNAENKFKWKRDKRSRPSCVVQNVTTCWSKREWKLISYANSWVPKRMNDGWMNLWMMRWILSVMLWSMFETHGRVEWMKRSSLKGLIDERMNEPMNAVNERTNKWTTINPGGYARGALAVKYCKEFWKRRTHLRWEKRMHAIEERKKKWI